MPADRWIQLAILAVAVVGVIVAVVVANPSASTPSARISLLPLAHNAVVPESIDRLPTPPAFRPNASQDHCAAWRAWFAALRAAELSVPTLEVAAPADADVTVTSARLRVYAAYQPPALSNVMCLYGAGPSVGTLLNVDLDHPNAPPTIVAADGSDKPLSFPNAVITIPRGHTEFIAVTPHGSARLYDWSIELHVVVDQRDQTLVYGARKHLRSWLGEPPAPAYDFNPHLRTWAPA